VQMEKDLHEKEGLFVGPKNVFIGPAGRRVSCANSLRIERNFVTDGPTAEECYCLNAARC
jgi:hypothetical protein